MKNKKGGQLSNIEDYFKSFITLIVGVIFITALVEIVPSEIKSTFTNIAWSMIVLGIIILLISILPKRMFR